MSVSEALVLGLLNQGVRKYVGILGHGNTDIANILSLYEEAGLVRMLNVRHEVEAAHCATMLRWHYGEVSAVITSIGPGALHAFAGSLASASEGVGVYHIYGDETTHDEGPNMQQIPKARQGGFLDLVQTMGNGYLLHTPNAIFTALRRGATTVFHPYRAGPFFFLMPMNVQPMMIPELNMNELPCRPEFHSVAASDDAVFHRAIELIRAAKSPVIKLGGGAGGCGPEIQELAELIDAVIVHGPQMAGTVPASHPRNMGVGGSKGSICGNFAMNQADLAIVIGSRQVCQMGLLGNGVEEGPRADLLQHGALLAEPLQSQPPGARARKAEPAEAGGPSEEGGLPRADRAVAVDGRQQREQDRVGGVQAAALPEPRPP